MPDLSPNLCIRRYPLTTDWTPVVAEIHCSALSVSSDVVWEYCSDPEEPGGFTTVGANTREPIPPCAPAFAVRSPSPNIRFPQGTGIVYVKAKDTPSFIWIHFVR